MFKRTCKICKQEKPFNYGVMESILTEIGIKDIKKVSETFKNLTEKEREKYNNYIKNFICRDCKKRLKNRA